MPPKPPFSGKEAPSWPPTLTKPEQLWQQSPGLVSTIAPSGQIGQPHWPCHHSHDFSSSSLVSKRFSKRFKTFFKTFLRDASLSFAFTVSFFASIGLETWVETFVLLASFRSRFAMDSFFQGGDSFLLVSSISAPCFVGIGAAIVPIGNNANIR